MADYEVTFLHNGRQCQAIVCGDGFRDAFERLESLKSSGVLSDEIVQVIHAPEMDIGKARRLASENP